ncbi:MAG: hypothetical protein P4L73_00415 [Caulobacteraceae bacterium]|nr:hypothetical protein [Caulobacteraceae bacterium]
MPLEAYKEGRKDERRQIDAGGLDHRLVKKELDDAYVRGRREGLSARRLSLSGLLSAVALAALLIATAVMVYQYGSFAAAGSAIDRSVAAWV